LIGKDLGNVVLLRRRADHVARSKTSVPARLVAVQGQRPLAAVIGTDADVIEHVALPDEVADLLEDG
jgi:hypothetical protein